MHYVKGTKYSLKTEKLLSHYCTIKVLIARDLKLIVKQICFLTPPTSADVH